MRTEQEIRSYMTNYAWLIERIQTIAVTVGNIRGELSRRSEYDSFEIEGETLTANFSEYWSQPSRSSSVSFPMSYLWTENYAEIETVDYADRVEKAKAEAAAKKIQDEAEAQQKRDENDRRNYERLRKKFEGTAETNG